MDQNQTPADEKQPETEAGKETQQQKARESVAKTRQFFGSVLGKSVTAAIFVFGAVAGVYIEELAAKLNPEFFGPSVEELLEKEKFQDNFEALRSQIQTLEASGTANTGQLTTLLQKQEKYVANLQDRLVESYESAAKAKKAALEGVSFQSDFKIPVNSSATVAERGNVVGLIRFSDSSATNAQVNLNGKAEWMKPGDRQQFQTSKQDCTLVFMGGNKDTYTGNFDLVCKPLEG